MATDHHVHLEERAKRKILAVATDEDVARVVASLGLPFSDEDPQKQREALIHHEVSAETMLRYLPIRSLRRMLVSRGGTPGRMRGEALAAALLERLTGPTLETAWKIVLAYYYYFNPYMMGMAERCVQNARDLQRIAGIMPGGLSVNDGQTGDSYIIAAAQVMSVSYMDHISRAMDIQLGCLPHVELLRHAQRILTVWAFEVCALSDHPELLPRLLAFDFEYLLRAYVVEKLNSLRTCNTSDLQPSQRQEFADNIARQFIGTPGRTSNTPSPNDIKQEYLETLGELEKPTEEQTVDTRCLVPCGRYYAYRVFEKEHAKKPPSMSEEQWRRAVLKSNYKSYVVCREDEIKPLCGFEKVLAIHFPFVLYDPTNHEISAFEKDVPGQRLRSERPSIIEEYLKVSAKNERRATGKPPRGYSHLAQRLLSLKYGLSESTVKRYVQGRLSTNRVTIRCVDRRRDWAMVESWIPTEPSDPPFPGCPFPREFLTRTRNALSCGVTHDELLEVAFYSSSEDTSIEQISRSRSNPLK